MYHYYTMISLLKVNTNSKLLNMSVLETMLFLIKVIYDSVYDTLELNKSKFKSKILVDKYIYLSLSWDIKVSTLQEKIQYAWIIIEDILYVYIYIYHKMGRRSQMTRVFFSTRKSCLSSIVFIYWALITQFCYLMTPCWNWILNVNIPCLSPCLMFCKIIHIYTYILIHGASKPNKHYLLCNVHFDAECKF